MSVKKQICVNQLAFPEEVLAIIKSYAFTDIVSYMAKKRKQSIDRVIDCSKWTSEFIIRKHRLYFLRSLEEDPNFPEYLMYFCSTCGNYKSYRSRQNQKVNCVC